MNDNAGMELKIYNKMIEEKRDLNIYHNYDRGSYMISHNNYVKIKLNGMEHNDYLHISIVSGPGATEKDCWLNMPGQCFLSFSGMCNGDIFHINQRTVVRIPPGPPVWQLKISSPCSAEADQSDERLIIGDFEYIREERLTDKNLDHIFCNAI